MTVWCTTCPPQWVDERMMNFSLKVSRLHRMLSNSHPVALDVASVTDRGQPMGPNQAPPATAAMLMSA